MNNNGQEYTPLERGELIQLKRWNTPTIFNGWEQITKHNPLDNAFNLEEVRDFMPQMGPTAGYAITVVIQPSNPNLPTNRAIVWQEYRKFIAGIPGPKIVVVQDLDKPKVIGSFWGEVTSNFHRALGCVATITDGSIRDVDEMTAAGFKAIARRLAVSHAYSAPIRWDCEVEVFGTKIQPRRLIHADKHGFVVIPPEDERRLLAAARFMDNTEAATKLAASWIPSGMSTDDLLTGFDRADDKMTEMIREHFHHTGD
ncbi:MAG TPA: RraA family protein [Anaerolineae bacterium]|nr:RraA family protein [Anaerolineae bacterium]